jgi:hypothetical protein
MYEFSLTESVLEMGIFILVPFSEVAFTLIANLSIGPVISPVPFIKAMP